MAVEFICDGCGKREPGRPNDTHRFHHPEGWRSRRDEVAGIQHSCSERCCCVIADRVADEGRPRPRILF